MRAPFTNFCCLAILQAASALASAQTFPSISNVTDKGTLESTAAATIALTINDAETPAADLIVTASSSDSALIPASGITLGGSGATRTITLTPASGLSGSATITLTVTDQESKTALDTFVLTVTPVFTLPGEIIPDLALEADGQFTVHYQIPDASWISSATRTNTTLFQSVGTSTSSSLRLQPAAGGTSRTLRIRPNDRSTSAGLYGVSAVTLVLSGTGAPTVPSFLVTVNPRAVADNQLLGIPGTTSTFDVLANDVIPLPGHAFSITSVTSPAHGTLDISNSGSLVRYTPAAGYLGPDTFQYTVTITSGDSFNGTTFTGIGYIIVGNFIVVDSAIASQHTDIGINFRTGVWTQNIKTDAVISASVQSGSFSPTLLDSDEGILFFDPSTKLPRPANGSYNFDFMGVPAGADIWQAPATPSGNKIYLGFASEDTPISELIPYETGDPRATGSNEWIETQLVDYSGPGHFSGFDFTDPLRVHFDTADGLNTPADSSIGGNNTDTFFGFAGSHAHINWIFTQPGRYALTFRSRTKAAIGFRTSPDTTYYFDVDSISSTARPGENPPLAIADSAILIEDGGPLTIDVLANDSSSPDPLELLRITGKTNGTHGTVELTTSGLTYTPAANFAGSDSFTYTISDEHGTSATASVAITVIAVNDPPIFSGYAIETRRNQTATFAINTLLAATSDPENDAVSLTAVFPASTAGASVSMVGGNIIYVPPPDFTGLDTFTATFGDVHGALTSGHVQISVLSQTAASPPSFADLKILSNGDAQISFTGIPGLSYRIERSLLLVDWTLIGAAVLADSEGKLVFTDPDAPTTRAFYRSSRTP